MTSSIASGRGWISVVVILVILFIGSILALSNWGSVMALFGRGEPYSTLYLYELNGSIVPQGKIIALTEEDFQELPHLASVIRDNNQKPVQILENANRLYTISLTMEERYGYGGLAGSYLEYEGKYYFYDTPSIH